jgi:hypothetical protein
MPCGSVWQITALFFVYFVFDGIIWENSVELLAAMLLDVFVTARVIYFMVDDVSGSTKAKTLLGCIIFVQLFVGVGLMQFVRDLCTLCLSWKSRTTLPCQYFMGYAAMNAIAVPRNTVVPTVWLANLQPPRC